MLKEISRFHKEVLSTTLYGFVKIYGLDIAEFLPYYQRARIVRCFDAANTLEAEAKCTVDALKFRDAAAGAPLEENYWEKLQARSKPAGGLRQDTASQPFVQTNEQADWVGSFRVGTSRRKRQVDESYDSVGAKIARFITNYYRNFRRGGHASFGPGPYNFGATNWRDTYDQLRNMINNYTIEQISYRDEVAKAAADFAGAGVYERNKARINEGFLAGLERNQQSGLNGLGLPINLKRGQELMENIQTLLKPTQEKLLRIRNPLERLPQGHLLRQIFQPTKFQSQQNKAFFERQAMHFASKLSGIAGTDPVLGAPKVLSPSLLQLWPDKRNSILSPAVFSMFPGDANNLISLPDVMNSFTPLERDAWLDLMMEFTGKLLH